MDTITSVVTWVCFKRDQMIVLSFPFIPLSYLVSIGESDADPENDMITDVNKVQAESIECRAGKLLKVNTAWVGFSPF